MAQVSDRVRRLRKEQGITQEEVARRAGLTLNSYGDIERGHVRDPHLSSLEAIAQALGVSVQELVSEELAVPLDEAPSPAGPPSVVDLVLDAARQQYTADRQAIARAGESNQMQESLVHHENEAMLRLLERRPGDVAESLVDLARRYVWLEQENAQLRERVDAPRARSARQD